MQTIPDQAANRFRLAHPGELGISVAYADPDTEETAKPLVASVRAGPARDGSDTRADERACVPVGTGSMPARAPAGVRLPG
jgi:hypothetical protein